MKEKDDALDFVDYILKRAKKSLAAKVNSV